MKIFNWQSGAEEMPFSIQKRWVIARKYDGIGQLLTVYVAHYLYSIRVILYCKNTYTHVYWSNAKSIIACASSSAGSEIRQHAMDGELKTIIHQIPVDWTPPDLFGGCMSEHCAVVCIHSTLDARRSTRVLEKAIKSVFLFWIRSTHWSLIFGLSHFWLYIFPSLARYVCLSAGFSLICDKRMRLR